MEALALRACKYWIDHLYNPLVPLKFLSSARMRSATNSLNPTRQMDKVIKSNSPNGQTH